MDFRWNHGISIMVHFHMRYLKTTLSCFNETIPHFACSSFICCYNWLQPCIAMVTAVSTCENGFSVKSWHIHHGTFSHSIYLITTLSCFNETIPHFACSSFICCYNWLQSCIAIVATVTTCEYGPSVKSGHIHHGTFSHTIFDNNFVTIQWVQPTLCMQLVHMLLQLIAIVYCYGYCCVHVWKWISITSWHFHHGTFSHAIFDNNIVMFQWGHPTLCMQLVHMLLQLTAIVYCNGYCCVHVWKWIFGDIMTSSRSIFDNNWSCF